MKCKVSLCGIKMLLIGFISSFLNKIINHRNQLRHYRTYIKLFREQFDTISVDVDFSENLSVPIKYEPQFLNWSHFQVTVLSGILKNSGEKSYHPYLSNNCKHDQVFVHLAIEEVIKETEINPDMHIIIESDNCSQQYKSAPHFYHLQ